MTKFFEVAVGNPPYQTGIVQDESKIGKSPINVFHDFQEVASTVSVRTSFIYPGGRWLSRNGKGMDEFGSWLSNNPALQKVVFWVRSKPVFGPIIEISGGVSIVFTDSSVSNNGSWDLTTFYKDKKFSGKIKLPGYNVVPFFPVVSEIENAVLAKFSEKPFKTLNNTKLSFNFFEIASTYGVDNPDSAILCNEDFSNVPQPLSGRDTSNSDSNNPDSLSWVRTILNDGHGKGARVTWFWVPRDMFPERVYPIIDSWKVVISARNVSGINGRMMQGEILPPGTAHSYSRVTIGSFATEEEAINFFNWINTDFVRCLIIASGTLYGTFGSSVPMLEGYKDADSSEIDFTNSCTINDSLFKLYELDDDVKARAKELVSSVERFTDKSYVRKI